MIKTVLALFSRQVVCRLMAMFFKSQKIEKKKDLKNYKAIVKGKSFHFWIIGISILIINFVAGQ